MDALGIVKPQPVPSWPDNSAILTGSKRICCLGFCDG